MDLYYIRLQLFKDLLAKVEHLDNYNMQDLVEGVLYVQGKLFPVAETEENEVPF